VGLSLRHLLPAQFPKMRSRGSIWWCLAQLVQECPEIDDQMAKVQRGTGFNNIDPL